MVVAAPEGQAGAHSEWLNVEFNNAIPKADSFRNCHALAERKGVDTLDLLEDAGVGLPAVIGTLVLSAANAAAAETNNPRQINRHCFSSRMV
jgi:hypothetical protein